VRPVEVLPVRVVDPGFAAEIGVFGDGYWVARVAKVIDGGVAADEIVVAVLVAVADWVFDGDCCAREDAGGQREAACRKSSHRDRRQNDSSVRIVALELIKMPIDWMHPGDGLDLKETAGGCPSALGV
jgi:hypothetical protein